MVALLVYELIDMDLCEHSCYNKIVNIKQKAGSSMSLRQKEKSDMTHREIKSSALRLFLLKGYKNTSIQDIVTESGYSIGSFYKHYKTKRDVLAEIWNEHAIAFITHSIEEMKQLRTPDELADYLIDNSNAFDEDEKTRILAKAAQEDFVTAGKNYESIHDISRLYIDQIATLIGQFCPHTEKTLLLSHASVLDSIQYSHSKVTREKVGYTFLDEAVKRDILVLIHHWIEEDRGF